MFGGIRENLYRNEQTQGDVIQELCIEDINTVRPMIETNGNGIQTNQAILEEDEAENQNIVSYESLNKLDEGKQNHWKKMNFKMNTGVFMRFFLMDLMKLLFYSRKLLKNNNNEIKMDHLPHLFPEDQTTNRFQVFQKIIDEYLCKGDIKPFDMVKVFARTFKKELTLEISLIVFEFSSKLIGSILIRNLIDDIAHGKEKGILYMWASLIAIQSLAFVGFMHHANKINYCLFSQFRVTFMKLLSNKVSSLSAFTVKETNVGKLVNLVSNDLNTIELKSFLIISLLVIPFGLICVAIILYFRFGVYGVYGLLLMVCYIPFQILLAYQSSKKFAMKSNLIDKRVNLTNEVIEGIRLIKMYAWEDAFMHTINTIRRIELKKILGIQFILIFEHALSFSSGLLASFFIFSIVYNYGDRSTLTIGNMYASLDLIQFCKSMMIAFAGYGLSGLLELQVVFKRMADVVQIKSSNMTCIEGKNEFENAVLQKGEIKMKNFSAYWKSENPVLKNLNINIKPGQCISIVGRVGAGKSSLLSCLLKEIPRYKGSFAFNGKLAYVEQEPYIFSSTVRENIIFGKKYKEAFYNQVVEVCNLVDDFKILDHGDQTSIGERGINISGGQKARISLARAIYSQADIYLLDDPLSAVDAKVAKSLFSNAIRAFLKNSTVLLVTHQIHFTKDTDQIIMISEGQIVQQGTFVEMEEKLKELANQLHFHDESAKNSQHDIVVENGDEKQEGEMEEPEKGQEEIDKFYEEVILKEVEKKEKEQEEQEEQNNKNNNNNVAIKDSAKKNEEKMAEDHNDKHMKDLDIDEQNKDSDQVVLSKHIEDKKTKGSSEIFTKEEDEKISVSFQTYWELLKFSKFAWLAPLTLALFVSSEIINIKYTNFIGDYGVSSDYSPKEIIDILGYLTLGFTVNMLMKYSFLTLIIHGSSQTIQSKMIKSLLRSKVLFFDTTPTGRILNKFSTDIGILDQALPFTSQDTIEILCSHVVLMVNLAIINPYFLIVIFIELLFFYYFLILSKDVIIQSKQTDLRYRSPVFNFFASSIQGVLPIRVYEQEKLFSLKFNVLSDNSLRSSFLYWLDSRAFGAAVHMFSAISGIVGIYLLIGSSKSSSETGQSIVYFLSLSDSIQWGLRQLIQTDVAMSSTQRLLNMCKLEEEPALISDYDKKEIKKIKHISQFEAEQNHLKISEQIEAFPAKGKVEFINVKMKYREGLSLVLNGLSFNIESGMRVGCVGRTGAGKSSIIQTLFRMTEIEDSTDKEEIMIKIDGHNTKKLGLHTLRGGISMIPQIPFIFSGSILKNIDPLDEYSKEQIASVIEDIGLKDKIDSLPNKVNTDMTNASEIFSTGQKQLICLGRAILKKSKLLILDEATANVDMHTDELIQQKIKERFKGSTVITVAHRLNTIADYDLVIVMDKGKAIEVGKPYNLLNNQSGIFKQMVNHTGKKNAQNIYQTAKNAFFENN